MDMTATNEYAILKLKNLLSDLEDKIDECRMECKTGFGGYDNDDEIRKALEVLKLCEKEIINI